MTYFPAVSGLGDDSFQSQWCSTSNPQGSCSPVAGICKPMTAKALEQIKYLQTQLNRAAQVLGLSKVSIDGRIGSKTLALYNKIYESSLPNCDSLALITVTGAAGPATKSVADNLGAPAKVSSPVALLPSKANADGTVSHPPGLSIGGDITSIVTSPAGLIALAGVGYLLYTRKGKKGKPRKKSTRRSRRRRK